MQIMCKFSVIFAQNLRSMTPKWIFFDLDDTLFDFSSASLFSLQRLWEEESVIKDVFSTQEAFIDEYHIHNTRMWQLHERGEISSDFLKPERFRLTLFPSRHDSETEVLCRRLNRRYLEILGGCNAVCPGVTRLMERLKGKCLIGVLTNGFSEVQYRKMESTGINRFIQRIVISDEIGIQKPDPRIFRYAENATGAEKETTVMVGDNPDNDIRGALDSGWHAIFYDRKGKGTLFEEPGYLGRITDIEKVAEICGF